MEDVAPCESRQDGVDLNAAIAAATVSSRDEQRNRVGAHSHVKGLGLRSDGVAEPVHRGLVGQVKAREAAGLIVDLIKMKRMAGKGILLAGPMGTGKTAIAMGIAQELGPRVPFQHMVASEVYSQEVKKTEVLTENFRSALGVRVRELKNVYEGEVVEMVTEETENPHGGFGKAVSAVVLTLRSARGTKMIRLAPQVHRDLIRENIRVGDVVFIDATSGAVRRVGRSDTHASEVSLELEEYVSLPKGEVQKKKELVHDLTLHDLDIANSKPAGGKDIVSVMNQFLKPKKTEITEKLRKEVNKSVREYIDRGVAEMIPGVLFIDEAHMLDAECFAYLNKAIESPLSPVVILATNRGACRVRGTQDDSTSVLSPHGIPADFLDRLLIVQTFPYSLEELVQILTLRANTEGVVLEGDALAQLGEIAVKTSLRYACQLLSPAQMIAEADNDRPTVRKEDVLAADKLFLDAQSSAERLERQSELFLV